ncbi:ferrochelatase [Enhydrobacter aerosaccus]|uniref:Ferrochelatase n=1 Tax=Enhydrobacter aerosaccus TaxID=225324 RepID=A0A1T4QRT4_9HYPH|nr:ferrochelatase [Enhydrobacter aerosaccus]SKA06415.1 ferrochelatase [Enhydrobacter aerosaccus]
MKIAIILFNLGGPDSLEAVQPFLRNLFSDPAIITLPSWLRLPLAHFISKRRAPKALGIYEQIGGGSPILGQTEAQARALEEALSQGNHHEWRGYVCMRYWHPLTDAVVKSVARFAPDRIVLLPLYPQFSTTTTASSFRAWHKVAHFKTPTRTVESYPVEPGFIAASVELVKQGLSEVGAAPRRVLFSAHGLPEKVIKAGDPYQRQVEQTAEAIASQLGGVDWTVCYQSRVGPLKWIGPSTDAEIARAGADKVGVVLYPLSFVSEHSETLVELDIEYRHLADKAGVPKYVRVPTVGTHPQFIAGLANLVRAALAEHEEMA